VPVSIDRLHVEGDQHVFDEHLMILTNFNEG